MEKYWFSHLHDDSEAAFCVSPSAWHLEILQETSGERMTEKEKGEWGTGEEKKKKVQIKHKFASFILIFYSGQTVMPLGADESGNKGIFKDIYSLTGQFHL